VSSRAPLTTSFLLRIVSCWRFFIFQDAPASLPCVGQKHESTLFLPCTANLVRKRFTVHTSAIRVLRRL